MDDDVLEALGLSQEDKLIFIEEQNVLLNTLKNNSKPNLNPK